jgi:hypothetical protein
MKVVPCKPHCAEVAPAKLLQNDVAINQDFTDMNWMVPTNLVVCNALVFGLVAVAIQLVLRQVFFECFDLLFLLIIISLLLLFVLPFALFFVLLVSLVW